MRNHPFSVSLLRLAIISLLCSKKTICVVRGMQQEPNNEPSDTMATNGKSAKNPTAYAAGGSSVNGEAIDETTALVTASVSNGRREKMNGQSKAKGWFAGIFLDKNCKDIVTRFNELLSAIPDDVKTDNQGILKTSFEIIYSVCFLPQSCLLSLSVFLSFSLYSTSPPDSVFNKLHLYLPYTHVQRSCFLPGFCILLASFNFTGKRKKSVVMDYHITFLLNTPVSRTRGEIEDVR